MAMPLFVRGGVPPLFLVVWRKRGNFYGHRGEGIWTAGWQAK